MIRHAIYCVNCGIKNKQLRLNSEESQITEIETVEVDCRKCDMVSTVIFSDDKVVQAKIIIPVLKTGDHAMFWKSLDSDQLPIIHCPLCACYGLKELPTKDGDGLLECKSCKRAFEVEYS